MHILIDLRPLQSGKTSGIEIYIKNLVNALCKNYPNHQFYLWTNSKTRLPKTFPKFDFPNARRIHTNASNKSLTLLSSFFRFPEIDDIVETEAMKQNVLPWSEKFDAVLYPDPRPAPTEENAIKMMIFHDLSPIHFPHFFNARTKIFQKLINFKKEAQESNLLFTPSLFTKQDLEKTFGISPEKITVISAGSSLEGLNRVIDEEVLLHVKKKYNLPEKFFLSLSTLEKRKNLSTLIRGYQLYFERNIGEKDPWHLVLSGQKNDSIFPKEKYPEHSHIHFPGFIDEVDKPALYSLSQGFIFPSLFEGFGIPVLEAMQMGCPVISSDFSSLPEVYGEAAISIDPTNPQSIYKALQKVFTNPDLKKSMQQKSLQQASKEQFSWDYVAKTLIEKLEETIEDQINL